MDEVVVDASAILAAIQQEPGCEAIWTHGRLTISAVNLAEARTKLVDRGFTREAADMSIELFNMTVVPFGEADAVATAELRRSTRSAGLSLGDRACLALAASRNVVVLTTDRAWQTVDVPVQIEIMR